MRVSVLIVFVSLFVAVSSSLNTFSLLLLLLLLLLWGVGGGGVCGGVYFLLQQRGLDSISKPFVELCLEAGKRIS